MIAMMIGLNLMTEAAAVTRGVAGRMIIRDRLGRGAEGR